MPWPPRASPSPSPSRTWRSPTPSPGATSSARRRPGPARPWPSGSRSWIASPRPSRAVPTVSSSCPTRELANQVRGVLAPLGRVKGLKVKAFYGGVGMEPQIEALTKGVDVVIGTPGRLIDLMERRELSVADVQVLVLDEADRMADMGFMPQVQKILHRVEGDHQIDAVLGDVGSRRGPAGRALPPRPGLPRGRVRGRHGRRDAPPLPAGAPDGQGQGRRIHRERSRPHARVLSHQARRRPPGRAAAARARQGRGDPRRPPPGGARAAPSRTSRAGSSRSSSPPTSRRAGSTSTRSTWSSTTTRPRTTRHTCTVPGVQLVPARSVSR